MSKEFLSEKEFIEKHGQTTLNKVAKAAATWYEFNSSKSEALKILCKNKDVMKDVLNKDVYTGSIYRGIAIDNNSKMAKWSVGDTVKYKNKSEAESWTTKLATAESFATSKKWHGGKDSIPKLGLVIRLESIDKFDVLLAPENKTSPWFIKHIDKYLDNKILSDVHKESEYLIMGDNFEVVVQSMSLNKSEEELEKGLKGALAGTALALAPGALNSQAPVQHKQAQIPNYGPNELKTNLGPEFRPEPASTLGPQYKDNQTNYPSVPKEHKMVFDPKTLHPDLIPIAHLESSFGKNMKHGAHSKGAYHTAIGALGFKPSTAHEEYLRSKHLQKLFPGHTEQNQFMDEIKDNPSFYNALAAQHWGNIKKRLGGSLERATFAWRWGQGAAERADDKTIQNDGYVKSYKKLAEKLATPETEVQKSEIQDLEKMAIANFKPGNQISEKEHDYTHILPEEHIKAGYQLKVSNTPYMRWGKLGGPGQHQTILTHNGNEVGNLKSDVIDKNGPSLSIYDTRLLDEHQNKSLGSSMYEATMAHAYHKLKINQVIGGTHSTMASKTHKRISDKHGMDYKQVENWGPDSDAYEDKKDWNRRRTGAFDDKYKAYNYVIKSEDLEKMAIADIKPGIKTGEDHDYTHVLPKEHQDAGYKLKVIKNDWSDLDTDTGNEYQAILTHKNREVGSLNGSHHPNKKGKDFEFRHSEINDAHTGKGLGTSMYEAMMAHAHHILGSKNIIGSVHSTPASYVHRKVSKKHGMGYKRELNYGPKSDDYKDLDTWTKKKSGAFDNKYKAYKYTIKSELDKSEDIYNYDHLLSHDHLNQGYSIRTIEHGADIGQEHVLLHNGRAVGELVTKFHDNQDLARLSKDHRGKGLGQVLLNVADEHNQLAKTEIEDLEKKVLDPSLGYTFSHEHHDLGDGDMLTHIKAHHPNGEVAGEVMFEHHSDGMLKPADVTVHPNHRRIGLASSMYSYGQKLTGKPIKPSTAQTEMGQALWQGNSKSPQFGASNTTLQPTMKYDKFDKSAKEWTEKQLNKSTEFIHYSHLPILKELDPSFQGTGLVKGQERERPNRPPRAYVYLGKIEPEPSVTTLSLYKYQGSLPERAKIYNIRKDPLGLLSPGLNKTEDGIFYIPPDLDKVERELIKLGYSGYTNYAKQYPEATALFVKVPLKRI